jgi:hypothetical protein
LSGRTWIERPAPEEERLTVNAKVEPPQKEEVLLHVHKTVTGVTRRSFDRIIARDLKSLAE